MEARVPRRMLFAVLILLAVGGLFLHYRVHPFLLPDKNHPGVTIFRGSFLAAALLPLLDLGLVTALFARRHTAVYGYLLNGLIVIYGTVLMGHFSIATLAGKTHSPADWMLRSTFPDIAIAWADFFAGKALYDSWRHEIPTSERIAEA